jgi:CO/xanthine dehydrogenase FAD-binding subunit
LNVQNYIVAKTCDEAYQRLNEDRKNKILGGGAWLKISVKDIHQLISLEALELDYIHNYEDFIEIGALTSLRTLETSKDVNDVDSGLLAEAISKIMGVGIRNLATIGGSVMGKFSFSDILPALAVMDVTLNFHHAGEVGIERFLSDRSLQQDLLKSLKIFKHQRKSFFKKVATTHLDFSMVNLALVKGDSFHIAVGSRPGIALLCHRTAEFLNKQDQFNDDILEQACKILVEETALGTNLRASQAYRETLVTTYLKRAVKKVML